jgi:hemoglobin
MTVHHRIHALHPFSHADFQRWLELFRETLDDHFEGPKTELVMQRALSIATVIEIKLLQG